MPPDKAVRFGFALCLVGLAIAVVGLLPQFTGPKVFPWPVIAGSAVYFPGAFLAFISARGREKNQVLMWIRLVRLGFFAVLLFSFWRMAQG